MTLDWKSAYAAMHRDGAAAYPPAALHYVLQAIRSETRGAVGPLPERSLTPAQIITTFRKRTRADFGPLADAVLEDWNLRAPEDLGRAVLLLGRYGCVALGPLDTLEAFAGDDRAFRAGEEV